MPPPRAKNWCFTFNNPPEGSRARILLWSGVRYIVVGNEVGESGTPHLQGFVSFVKQLRFSKVKELLPSAHWEVARNASQSAEYCKKDGDYEEVGTAPKKAGARVDLEAARAFIHGCASWSEVVRGCPSQVLAKYGRWCRQVYDSKEKEPFYAVLQEWQSRLVDMLSRPADPRKIHFYVDQTGGKGKSFVARYLVCNFNAFFASGKSADVLYAYDNEPIILWDIPRSQQEFMNYGAIEKLKDGLWFSGKYESAMRIRQEQAHVVVFMNDDPDMCKLSNDRYDIKYL